MSIYMQNVKKTHWLLLSMQELTIKNPGIWLAENNKKRKSIFNLYHLLESLVSNL